MPPGRPSFFAHSREQFWFQVPCSTWKQAFSVSPTFLAWWLASPLILCFRVEHEKWKTRHSKVFLYSKINEISPNYFKIDINLRRYGEGKRVMQAKTMLEVFPGSNFDQPQTAFWNESGPSYATWGIPWPQQRGWLYLCPSSQHDKEYKCLNIREISYLTVVISKKDLIFSYFLKKKKTQILMYVMTVKEKRHGGFAFAWCQALPPHSHSCVQTLPFTPKCSPLHITQA